MATMMLIQWLCILACCITTGKCMCATCPAGWVLEKDTCYIYGRGLVSWEDAQSICQLYGANLPEVENEAKNTFLKNFARSKQAGRTWIGGHDLFEEGQWQWTVNKHLTFQFSDWLDGQPSNNEGDEHCLELYNPANYKWNDNACSAKNAFICEKKANECD